MLQELYDLKAAAATDFGDALEKDEGG